MCLLKEKSCLNIDESIRTFVAIFFKKLTKLKSWNCLLFRRNDASSSNELFLKIAEEKMDGCFTE